VKLANCVAKRLKGWATGADVAVGREDGFVFDAVWSFQILAQ
jgi:hypothetical protein